MKRAAGDGVPRNRPFRRESAEERGHSNGQTGQCGNNSAGHAKSGTKRRETKCRRCEDTADGQRRERDKKQVHLQAVSVGLLRAAAAATSRIRAWERISSSGAWRRTRSR